MRWDEMGWAGMRTPFFFSFFFKNITPDSYLPQLRGGCTCTRKSEYIYRILFKVYRYVIIAASLFVLVSFFLFFSSFTNTAYIHTYINPSVWRKEGGGFFLSFLFFSFFSFGMARSLHPSQIGRQVGRQVQMQILASQLSWEEGFCEILSFFLSFFLLI